MLLSVKEQLRPEEMVEDPWALRAAQAGLEPEEYCRTAEELDRKQVIGRFATFLEHVRTKTNDGPVTKYNGLFHWTVPAGMEIRAGAECGRHICMTHCYWRTGGDIFGGAQIMGVVGYYMENARVIRESMSAAGYTVYGGIDAPYIWIQVPDGDSWKFFDTLLNTYHVIATPGAGFGAAGEGYLRMTAFASQEDTLEAMARISKG